MTVFMYESGLVDIVY